MCNVSVIGIVGKTSDFFWNIPSNPITANAYRQPLSTVPKFVVYHLHPAQTGRRSRVKGTSH